MTKFQAPEFYNNGPILRLTHANDDTIFVDIFRDGQAIVYYDQKQAFGDVVILRTAEEFREQFPDGIIPDDDSVEWRHNGWFDLYTGDDYDHLDRVEHSFSDALATAWEELQRIYNNRYATEGTNNER